MNKKAVATLIACSFSIFMFGQSSMGNDCNKVREGIFYFYPKNEKNGFIIIRDKNIQREVDLTSRDTTIWDIKWTDKCEFSLKFISKSKPLSTFERTFYNSHLVIVKVLEVVDECYVFKLGLDTLVSKNAMIDTLWFKPRL